jgi:hypothetical protein
MAAHAERRAANYRGAPSGRRARADLPKWLIANYCAELARAVLVSSDVSRRRSDPMKNALPVAAVAALIPLAGLAAQDARNPDPDPVTRDSRTRTTDPGTPATSGSASFEALDANKDGRISMVEASVDPRLVEEFSIADKNGDGYLDSNEYAVAIRTPPQQ